MRTITDHIGKVPVVRAPQKPRSRGFWPATQGSLLPCAAAARRPRLPFPMLFIASRVAMGRCGCPAAAGRRPTAALRLPAGRGGAGLEGLKARSFFYYLNIQQDWSRPSGCPYDGNVRSRDYPSYDRCPPVHSLSSLLCPYDDAAPSHALHTSRAWRTSRHIAPKPKKNGQRAKALPHLVPDTGSDAFARARPGSAAQTPTPRSAALTAFTRYRNRS